MSNLNDSMKKFIEIWYSPKSDIVQKIAEERGMNIYFMTTERDYSGSMTSEEIKGVVKIIDQL